MLDAALAELRAAATRPTLLGALSFADIAAAQVLAFVSPPAFADAPAGAASPIRRAPASLPTWSPGAMPCTTVIDRGLPSRHDRGVKLLAVVGLTLAVPTADADCMRVDLGAALLTPTTAALPPDGGVLVGWKQIVNGEPNDDPAHPKWTFSTPMVAETLAPSLVVHRPKTPLAADLAIADAKGKSIAKFKRDPRPAAFALDAPAVSSLAITGRPSRWGDGRTVTAALSAKIPDRAVAIIGYVVRDKKSLAIEFAAIDDRAARAIVTYADPGHCGFNPSGLDVPRLGETMTFVYVDQFGRLSKPSAAVVPITTKP